MRLSGLIIWCLGLGLWLPGFATAQVDLSTSLNTTEILIGDHVQMKVQLSAPAGTRIEAWDYSALEKTEAVEILEMGPPLTVAESPRLLMEQEILLTSYDSGYHVIPALGLRATTRTGTDTIYSNDLALTVETLPVSPDDPLEGNKDIIEEPVNWRDYLPYLIGLIGALLLIGVAWYVAGRRALVPSKPPPPPPPPHAVALEKLDRLRKEAAWEKGEVKYFQSELTYVLREYLENRFGLTALESTTAEIDQQLQKGDPLLKTWRSRLGELLQRADMVKFAKAIPPVTIHHESLDEVSSFVESTKKEEQPQEEGVPHE